MEPSPVIGVIIVGIAAIGSVIITAIITSYETRRHKREYKKKMGRDYDQDMARFMGGHH